MVQKHKNLKTVTRGIIEQLPIISDFYAHHWDFSKNPNVYRGVFPSFDAAQAAIPQSYQQGYHIPHHEDIIGDGSTAEAFQGFEPKDYPVIFWLKAILEEPVKTLVDLGGNTGVCYYTYQRYLNYPNFLRWIICDVSKTVEIGEKIAQKKSAKHLDFVSSLEAVENCDILLTCGTLQYIKKPLKLILQELGQLPQHLLINRTPLYNGKPYVTLQNLLNSIVPYKIQNRSKLIASITELGYSFIDSWHNDRTCTIPFHPECFVSGYHGFYFRLDAP